MALQTWLARNSYYQNHLHNILELLNAVNALGFLLGVHEAAEGTLEVLSAGSVCHATKTRAVPVDLASLRVECGLLASLILELLGLRSGPFLPDLGSDGIEGLGVGIFAILFADRRKKRD